MEIILMDKVVNLGNLGDVVKVKDGYARNFLIPQGMAKRANKVNIAAFAERKAELEKQAAEKQQVERNKRQAQTQQERQAECERQAIEQHQDPRQCQSEAQPKGQPGNPNRDNNGK